MHSAAPKYEVHVLRDGYSYNWPHDDAGRTTTRANGTCTLVKALTGVHHVLVDTLSPWDSSVIVAGLTEYGLTTYDIRHVVCTHGHVDHVGNLNLFTRGTSPTEIIVGYSIVSKGDRYLDHPFDEGVPYRVADGLEVIATPGHTANDVSVIVQDVVGCGTVAIVGDLFEREEDIDDPSLWRDVAGSEDPAKQRFNRSRVLHMADYVVPGHGKMFQVTDAMRQKLDSQLQDDGSGRGHATEQP